MKFFEREEYLEQLNDIYNRVSQEHGHSVFIYGEAGIGKSSLVNYFLQHQSGTSYVFSGACDSLYTPRPLGPLYDISSKIGDSFSDLLEKETSRSLIFSAFLDEIQSRSLPVILIFEDIHWADEATNDLIKFLSRRIRQTKCLFILTFRDNETAGPRMIIADIPPDHFTRIEIAPLSKGVVDRWAEEAGYSGEDIFKLTNGNPFYISEILASYSTGIPENIKDSILNVFYRQNDEVREFWEKISIHPGRVEVALLEKIDPDYLVKLDACLRSSVLQTDGKYIYFKHDLYRRTIEETINPIRTRLFHKEILNLILKDPRLKLDYVRVVHYAKKAEDDEKITEYAPKAAADAAKLGAHSEAAILYKMAIASTSQPEEQIISLYERYAYECYLTNQIREAILYVKKILSIYNVKKNKIKEGDNLRFLSRLWWFEGQREKAEKFAWKAIEVLESESPTREKALAYSNYAQLKMLAYKTRDAVHWAVRSIELAEKLGDNEIICHALNNKGTALIKDPAVFDEGNKNLENSLEIAMKYGLHEHVARAYTNLSSTFILIKKYDEGLRILEQGIVYCQEHDLNSWTYYMQMWEARAFLEKGDFDKAERISRRLSENPDHPPVVKIGAYVIYFLVHMRQGNIDHEHLLFKASKMALESGELQRIIPVVTAFMEYFWLYGKPVPVLLMNTTIAYLKDSGDMWSWGEFIFWISKTRLKFDLIEQAFLPSPYDLVSGKKWKEAGKRWGEAGCPYYMALCLMECGPAEKKEALKILGNINARQVQERLKQDLREIGIKSIPKGPRLSTLNNPSGLTNRQLEVLELLRKGFNNQEISERLFLSRKTVEHHVSAIMNKLMVNSRIKAVGKAVDLGILK